MVPVICIHGLFDYFTIFAGFWYPARKHLYFISVSSEFLGTSLPPTPISAERTNLLTAAPSPPRPFTSEGNLCLYCWE